MAYYGTDPWIAVPVLLLAAGAVAREKYRDWRTPDEGTAEHVQALYANGEIDLAELERRLDVIEDPEAERIRSAAERVSGIGEDTSWAIAAAFDSLDDVREADEERLREVSNVGEQRAKALKEEL